MVTLLPSMKHNVKWRNESQNKRIAGIQPTISNSFAWLACMQTKCLSTCMIVTVWYCDKSLIMTVLTQLLNHYYGAMFGYCDKWQMCHSQQCHTIRLSLHSVAIGNHYLNFWTALGKDIQKGAKIKVIIIDSPTVTLCGRLLFISCENNLSTVSLNCTAAAPPSWITNRT